MATFICSSCGEEYPLGEEHYELGEEIICAVCANEETVICERCGERIWRDDNAGSEDMVLCQSCYDDYYVSCESCGRIIRRTDAYYEEEEDSYLCADCHFNYTKEREIKDYYYKPKPIFYGKKPRFLGVELEIDEGGEKAVYWFSKSAAQGYADAQSNLGICYYFGVGVEKDRAKAAYWFFKAAEQGNANAKKGLNLCKSLFE